jgi:hypothetical protein
MVDLLRLIARRTRQGLLVLKHGTEIPHFKPTAAGFTFPKMTGLTQRRAADWLADDFTARDRWRHTGDLDHSSSVSSINPWLSTTLPFCVTRMKPVWLEPAYHRRIIRRMLDVGLSQTAA